MINNLLAVLLISSWVQLDFDHTNPSPRRSHRFGLDELRGKEERVALTWSGSCGKNVISKARLFQEEDPSM